MPAPNSNDSAALGDEPVAVTGPPEETDIWERYNKRMEFPLAAVATVFLHVVVGAVLIYVLVGLMDAGEDRSNPPMQIVSVGGIDDGGDGSTGGGGESTDLIQTTDVFKGGNEGAFTPDSIPNVKEDIPKVTLPDNTGKLPLPAPSGGVKGSGRPAPKGEGVGGTGPGGTGADSTAARGHRWVLRFRVVDAKDYLAQLKAMGAEISVPLPPDEKQHILIRDLKDPRQKAIVGDLKELKPKEGDDAEVKRLKGLLGFYDTRPNQVREVTAALGVNSPTPPRVFRAHFPKSLEEEMDRKEKSYRNRRPDDIENTFFRVVIRGGSYELVVDEQVVKK